MLGCSYGPQLEPAQSAQTTWQGAAFETREGVRVVAEGDIWAGEAEVRKYVTPVQIRFENAGLRPLRVRYRSMSLLGAEGQVFRALPPFRVPGSVTETVDELVPGFEYEDIAVASHLGPLYPGLEVEPLGTELPGDASDDELAAYWRVELGLPSPFMLEVAMPEAVVRPGGLLSGFVYFERVPESKQRVTLHVDLVDAATGQSFARVALPFVVD